MIPLCNNQNVNKSDQFIDRNIMFITMFNTPSASSNHKWFCIVICTCLKSVVFSMPIMIKKKSGINYTLSLEIQISIFSMQENIFYFMLSTWTCKTWLPKCTYKSSILDSNFIQKAQMIHQCSSILFLDFNKGK